MRPASAAPTPKPEGIDDVVTPAIDEHGGMVFRWLSPQWP